MDLSHKLGLGTVQFGIPYGISNLSGQTSPDEVRNILNCAAKNEISIIDTASAYGNAETILGNNDLTGFNVISKFMPPSEDGDIEKQLIHSLKKLKLNALYGYLAHRPLDLLNDDKQWDTLLSLKESDKIEKIGYSLNQTHELEQLLKAGMFPDLIQVPFNFLDNRFKDLMIELKAQGCEIHTRSTFLQGLFFMNSKKLPDQFNSIRQTLDELQATYGNNLSGALLRYVLSLDYVDVVVMGVENENQLLDNLKKINNARKINLAAPQISEEILMPSKWPKM